MNFLVISRNHFQTWTTRQRIARLARFAKEKLNRLESNSKVNPLSIGRKFRLHWQSYDFKKNRSIGRMDEMASRINGRG
jgi:hypothetical protein